MVILQIVIAMFIGVGTGVLTGLTPGLHVNTVSMLMLASLSWLSGLFSPLAIAVFLVAMIVTSSFLDFVPSIFLGAPDPATALSVLPGHELLFKGEGHRAVILSAIGGLGAFLVSLPIVVVLFFAIKSVEAVLSTLIPFILIGFSAFFILKERGLRKKVWAIIIFLLSGCFGLVVLSGINVKEPLFPLFSGIFGISSLILSLGDDNKIPEQNTECSVEFWKNTPNYLKAAFSSLLVSILPGVGAAQAAGISQAFTKFKAREDFLVIVGGISTAGCLFTLASLFLLGKVRSGVMAALDRVITIDFNGFLVLIAASICAAGFGTYLTLKFSKMFARRMSKINYKLVSIVIIVFISAMVGWLSGLMGLLILSVSVAMGLLAPLVGCRRIHAMGLLVLPILAYFLR